MDRNSDMNKAISTEKNRQTEEEFFVGRLIELRADREVSARKMSIDLQQNSSYINRIENKKAFPSMQLFFDICEYLHVTPGQFFDRGGGTGRNFRRTEGTVCSDAETYTGAA